ncbi:MAG: tripartite tricarboxylate transporter substrate binding protein [Rhodospirillales bacterium]|jgi:putative tricarboxylic transport membrane protein
MKIRKFVSMSACAVAGLAMMAFTTPAHAWKPSGKVEILTGCKTGCGPDRIARILQKIWKKHKLVDAKVVVVNKAGGGNSIALKYLQEAAGKGDRLMLSGSAVATSYYTGRSPIGTPHLTAVALLITEYIATAVKGDSPIKSAKQLISMIKKDPKSVAIGTATSRGNSNHQAITLAAMSAGIDPNAMKFVIFQSGRIGRTNLLGGHVTASQSSVGGFIKHHKKGKLRILAVSSPERLGGAVKNVPTWKEQGFDVVVPNLRALLGPKGMTKAQTDYWDKVVEASVKTKIFQKSLGKRQMKATFMGHAEFTKYMRGHEKQMKSVLKTLGILKRK